MKVFGLIGFPLTHSFSQKYFTVKFENEGISLCRYDNFPLEKIEEITGIIKKNRNLSGLNVTIPYKQTVIPFLNELDDTARQIGAVNTIKIYRTGNEIKLKGFNTDAFGFMQSISPFLKDYHTKALILGTGGSSKAVAYVLKEMGIDITFVSRNPSGINQIGYNHIDEKLMSENLVIVNTSPAGMFPGVDKFPDIPYRYISANHVLFDLIYNPPETLFLLKGKEKGANVINGLPMLHAQAEKAWEIWNNEDQ